MVHFLMRDGAVVGDQSVANSVDCNDPNFMYTEECLALNFPELQATHAQSSAKSDWDALDIISASVGSLLVLILASLCLIVFRNKRKAGKIDTDPEAVDGLIGTVRGSTGSLAENSSVEDRINARQTQF